MKIQVIIASTRPERVGERVGRWVFNKATSIPDFDVELVDLLDYDLPFFNEAISPRFNPNRQPSPVVAGWLAKISQADGYVIVTPEYNHSVPASIKNALDYINAEMAKKPVAIVSYGAGASGLRAAEHLKQIVSELKAAVVPEGIGLPILGAPLLEADGTFIGDTSNPYGPDGALGQVLTELSWWTSTLAAGRKLAAAAPTS